MFYRAAAFEKSVILDPKDEEHSVLEIVYDTQINALNVLARVNGNILKTYQIDMTTLTSEEIAQT